MIAVVIYCTDFSQLGNGSYSEIVNKPMREQRVKLAPLKYLKLIKQNNENKKKSTWLKKVQNFIKYYEYIHFSPVIKINIFY